MRRLLLTAAVFTLVACTSGANTTTTIDPIPPPPNPGPSTTALSDRESNPPSGGPFIEPITGHLPDGTPYTVYLETTEPEELIDINGWIMLEINEAIWAAEVLFFGGPHEHEPTFMDGIYTLPAGPDWRIVIEFPQGAIAAIGEDAETVIRDALQSGDINGDPVVEVNAPFRWARATDPTGPISVTYETIVVKLGCSTAAAACSQDQTVQVQAKPSYGAAGVTIDSFAGRLNSDPHYLDRCT